MFSIFAADGSQLGTNHAYNRSDNVIHTTHHTGHLLTGPRWPRFSLSRQWIDPPYRASRRYWSQRTTHVQIFTKSHFRNAKQIPGCFWFAAIDFREKWVLRSLRKSVSAKPNVWIQVFSPDSQTEICSNPFSRSDISKSYCGKWIALNKHAHQIVKKNRFPVVFDLPP